MIELISRKLANFLCKDDNEETFELYKYAVYIVLSSILHIVTIIILGVCFNLLIESILFYGSFISIRKFAGGYHAKTPTRCYIFSVISFLFVLLLIHIINNESCFSGYWWIIFEYLFVIVICKLSPLDTDNKLLNDKERMVYKGVTIVITNILCIISSMLINFEYFELAASIAFGIILSLIVLIMRKIQIANC